MKGLIHIIRGIIFDLDGTLLDRSESIKHFVNAQYYKHLKALNRISREDYLLDFITEDRNGYNHKKNVYSTLVRKYDLELEWVDLLFEDYHGYFHEHCTAIEGFSDLRRYLVETTLKIGLITNGESLFQMKTVEALSLKDILHSILISETEGVKKPSPELFHKGLHQLGVDAMETIFVGDHPINDILAAKDVGMHTIWIENEHYEQPGHADHTVKSLAEIPRIIEHLNKEGAS